MIACLTAGSPPYQSWDTASTTGVRNSSPSPLMTVMISIS